MILDELLLEYNKYGNILIKAYYKGNNKQKIYFDFNYYNDNDNNNQLQFEIINIEELIFYLKEDNDLTL